MIFPKDITQQSQHQGSLANQLKELMIWAVRLGMYDAADWMDVNAPHSPKDPSTW